jgi:tetratricopeptide (TPR) repeat protein
MDLPIKKKYLSRKETYLARPEFLVALFLILSTFSVYWQIRNHGFIYLDDISYVVENPHVRKGLTVEGITWAFVDVYAANWHPVTWLSHMLDCELYGMNPGAHHLTNLLFHLLNTLLLFSVLKRMTGDLWQSGYVAALFAIHPLHVESVAWIAERKDVLSTLFWMLTLWAYVRYVEHRAIMRYFLVFLFFLLGLLAKPMLVTMPFVMLLLDLWPLCRFRIREPEKRCWQTPNRQVFFRLIREKIPFFALSVASSAVTFGVQQEAGAVRSFEAFPIALRIFNALVSYVAYIVKTILPHDLAVMYPHPMSFPIWKVAGAVIILAVFSFFALKTVNRYPYFAVGWFWYLGTLVPVIGLIQVGMQAMADRYTYVPVIGLLISVTWGLPKLLAGWRYQTIGITITASFFLILFITSTRDQVKYWINSQTLFAHALKVTSNNFTVHNNLGYVLQEQGRAVEAMEHYLKAIRIRPDSYVSWYNLANVLKSRGRVPEAIEHYQAALRINPGYVSARNNLGMAYINESEINALIDSVKRTQVTNHDTKKIHEQLEKMLKLKENVRKAIHQFEEVLRIQPEEKIAKNNLRKASEIYDELNLIIAKLQEMFKSSVEEIDSECRIMNNAGLNSRKKNAFGRKMQYIISNKVNIT